MRHIPGGDEGIISLALHHLAKFAHPRKPAYSRPPFCCGSNPWPRVRIHIIKHNKKIRPLGVIFYCGGDEVFPRTMHTHRLRGNRDDLTALHWSNLLVVEPAICDCDGFAPFRFTGYNKMPRMGAFCYTWRR